MSQRILNPALTMLLWLQFRARWRRFGELLFAPHRRVRTLVCVALAVLWLGNAIATLMFRDPYSLAAFRETVALCLTAYFLWNVLKVVAFRPPAPIEWSPAERQILLTGPFTRPQRLAYRIGQTLPGTLFKAASVVFFFHPEIPVWWAGAIGALLAFTFLELLRLSVAIVACHAPGRVYRIGRVVVVAVVAVLCGVAIVRGLDSPTLVEGPIVAWSVTTAIGRELIAYRETVLGHALEAPFRAFASVIAAERTVSFAFLGQLALAATLCGLAGVAAFVLSRFVADDETESRTIAPRRRAASQRRFAPVPSLGGLGPIAWRQFLTARRLGVGVVIALLPPIVLACCPLVLDLGAEATFGNVVAAAAFYSFLLLPSAMKFDFRMDYERLATLKSLPIRPLALVLGQITVPVLITVGFQVLVVLVAWCVRPVPFAMVGVALLVLVPTTVVIFAIDNTLFLLSPHRLRQDGFEVLLKGLLTFTAKGVVFAVALVSVLVWVEGASMLADWMSGLGWTLGRRGVFVSGLAIACAAAAWGSVLMLAATFRRCEAIPRAE